MDTGKDCEYHYQNIFKSIMTNSYPSYLYPDGRSINPDLSWAVQATPEDHVKVRFNFYLVTETSAKLADISSHTLVSFCLIANHSNLTQISPNLQDWQLLE